MDAQGRIAPAIRPFEREWSCVNAHGWRTPVATIPLAVIKPLARALVGNYEIYRVFALDLHGPLKDPRNDLRRAGFTPAPVADDEVARARAPVIRASARYGGPGAQAFALLHDGEIVALEWYWFGATRQQGAFWPFGDDEAESAYVVTAPEFRGQGLAPSVKQFSAIEMRARGFRRAYAKIWHSHHASIGANEKTGFREIALVVDLYPFGSTRRVRWVRRRRHSDTQTEVCVPERVA
jgi:L-amino acid N-acyltransferase YncA